MKKLLLLFAILLTLGCIEPVIQKSIIENNNPVPFTSIFLGTWVYNGIWGGGTEWHGCIDTFAYTSNTTGYRDYFDIETPALNYKKYFTYNYDDNIIHMNYNSGGSMDREYIMYPDHIVWVFNGIAYWKQ